MSLLLDENRRMLDHPESKKPIIQHDFDFYSVVYYDLSSHEPVFFLRDQASGTFKRLPYGRWYMSTALEKLQKIPANEKHLITEELVNGFWYAIREGYNHMLDPNLRNEYDTPRIRNSIKAVQAYIKRIEEKGKERVRKILED